MPGQAEKRKIPGIGMRIYNKNASKENMLRYLQERYNLQRTMTFGTVPGRYDVLVEEDNFDQMVKLVRRKYEPLPGRGPYKVP